MKLRIILLFLSGFLLSVTLPAQQKETFIIEGTVYEGSGSPIQEAVIYLKDKLNIGTTSDAAGKFSIKANKGDIIIFSFVGYKQIEYYVSGEKKDLEVRFTEAEEELDEIVVVGLGSQRKISSVAAVSTVDVKELQVPTTSVANLLGGKIAGVISMQTSGEPGKNIADFWVRGIGTFGASQGALVLIDGLEGDINSIDVADIESFSILKDASATAVYGVRGANGVVLITTKRGEEGKLSITARANFSLSHLKRMPEYLRAYDYATLANEALVVRGDEPLYKDIEMEIIQGGLDLDMYPDVNWRDEILNTNSVKQSYYVSARGGGKVARYFLSLGISDETAAYKQDKTSIYSSNVGYNTYTFRTNLDMNLTKSTVLFFGTDGFLSIRNQPGMANTDYIWSAQSQINPLLLPTRYSNGMLPAAGANEMSSPYVLINHTGQSSDQQYRGKFTLALNQDLSALLDGLKFKIQGAYNLNSWFNEKRFIQPALYKADRRSASGALVMREVVQGRSAVYSNSARQYRKYHFEGTLNYDKLFGSDHRVSALVYYYLSDQQDSNDNGSSLTAVPVRYQGVSSRLTYSFRDTYMIDVNFGYTGSENFQPGRQYGFFPSIALGWVPSSYQFVKDNLPWINFFKIRGSYGSVGNDRIVNRRFPYLTMVSSNQNTIVGGVINSVETVNETVVGADNLAWEKAIKSDLGIEGRFWNNRISFVVDFFNDQRDGIFQQRVQVPDYVGVITMPFGNVGKMKSYGSDGNISYTEDLSKDMNFTIRGNFTYSKNLIQNWEQVYEKYPYLERIGLPNGIHRGFQSLGFFKDADDVMYSPAQAWGEVQPGDIKYKDVNGDGKITTDDKVPLSNSTFPLLMYGMGGEFRYKNFTVGVMFKGRGKTDYYRVGQQVSHNNMTYYNGMGYVPFHGGLSGNVLTMANDPANRWIPMDYALAHGIDPALAENPNALYPKLQYGYNENNSQLSDFWKGDSRYLRLQEITLNYNMKNKVLRKIGVTSVDFQLVGTNLHVWDKVKTFDPEQAQFNGRVYPIPAVYSLQIYIYL
ncbi:MAG: TonB-dependent receptor [Prevotellaceae bacterium]|jgi:TonB-linked SusC/RagA family outer membrane protein|nr:TonB-dependent receptor [Prevotellaceae bacterium]